MKLYTWTHSMLSTKQQGIQSQHATIELFNTYKETDLMDYGRSTGDSPPKHLVDDARKADMLFSWSEDFKTHISLDGGNSIGMNEILEEFKMYIENDDMEYPWAVFYEDKSLEGILTSISIILPEKVYKVSNLVKRGVISLNLVNGRLTFLMNDGILEEDSNEVMELIDDDNISFTDFDIWLIENLPKYRLAK